MKISDNFNSLFLNTNLTHDPKNHRDIASYLGKSHVVEKTHLPSKPFIVKSDEAIADWRIGLIKVFYPESSPMGIHCNLHGIMCGNEFINAISLISDYTIYKLQGIRAVRQECPKSMQNLNACIE